MSKCIFDRQTAREDLYCYVYSDAKRDMMSALVAVRVAVEAMTRIALIADDDDNE